LEARDCTESETTGAKYFKRMRGGQLLMRFFIDTRHDILYYFQKNRNRGVLMYEQFIAEIDEKWHDAFVKLMITIEENLPPGFEKSIDRQFLAYSVPLLTYPKGYHVNPNTPLPFLSIAAQKRHLALYHLGIYADSQLLEWFVQEYEKRVPTKLNMGKSCIRWTSTKSIPYDLIGELFRKMTVEQWIHLYEQQRP
jgi:hypothetical protein